MKIDRKYLNELLGKVVVAETVLEDGVVTKVRGKLVGYEWSGDIPAKDRLYSLGLGELFIAEMTNTFYIYENTILYPVEPLANAIFQD